MLGINQTITWSHELNVTTSKCLTTELLYMCFKLMNVQVVKSEFEESVTKVMSCHVRTFNVCEDTCSLI